MPANADTIVIYTSGSGDGSVYYYTTGAGAAYNVIRDHAGSGVVTTSNYIQTWVESSTTTNQYIEIDRVYYSFNLSTVPANTIIDSAKIGVYNRNGSGMTNALGSPTYGITRYRPATNGTAVAGDFNKIDNDYLSDTTINYTSVKEDGAGPNEWTLNALGISNITGNPYLNLMLRDNWDITNTSPSWVSGKQTIRHWWNSENGVGWAPRLTIVYHTTDTTPPSNIASLDNTTTCSQTNISWTNPIDPDFNHTYAKWNDVWVGNLTNTTTWYNVSGLSESTEYTLSTRTCDLVGNCNATVVNYAMKTSDCMAPVNVYNFQNTTTCNVTNISFSGSPSTDWNHTYTLWNNVFFGNLTNETLWFNMSGLSEKTEYTLSTKAVDLSWNINATQTDYSVTTGDCTAPDTISDITNSTTCNSITWGWTNPATSDFNHTLIWKDNIFLHLIDNTTTSDVWNSLSEKTKYNISIRTVDTSGNTNTDWINATVTTGDCTPPFGVSEIDNITTCDSIEWSWTNPEDSDFNNTEIWKNNVFQRILANTTNTDLWEGLSESTNYEIGIKTTDIVGNTNDTWMNKSSVTEPCGVAPTAAFSANVTSACYPQAIKFTDESTGIPTDWDWYITSDETKDSDLQDVTVLFSTPGIYNIRLFASNSYGSSWENKTGYITISDCTPPSGITGLDNLSTCSSINWTWTNPADTDFNHTFTMRDNVYNGNLSNATTSVNWTGLSELTEYTFSSKTCDLVGNCNPLFVNKTASTGPCGYTPVSGFSANNTSACVGDMVQFTDESTNIPTSWYWDLGDGNTSIDQHPIVQFNVVGIFDINMKASNSYGSSWENKTSYVAVASCLPPTDILSADFVANATCGNIPFAVQFNDTSIGNDVTDYYWNFNDGNESAMKDPNNTFVVSDFYSINHSVTNASGISWENKSNYILSAPVGYSCSGTGSGDAYASDDSGYVDVPIPIYIPALSVIVTVLLYARTRRKI